MKITLIGLGAVLGVAKQLTADMSAMFDDVLKLLLPFRLTMIHNERKLLNLLFLTVI